MGSYVAQEKLSNIRIIRIKPKLSVIRTNVFPLETNTPLHTHSTIFIRLILSYSTISINEKRGKF
jgi:hypothetical protein